MLRLTVEALKDAELSSPVGSKFEYGTMNYDVLGLVIEKVSGGRATRLSWKKRFWSPWGGCSEHLCLLQRHRLRGAAG